MPIVVRMLVVDVLKWSFFRDGVSLGSFVAWDPALSDLVGAGDHL